MPWVDRALLESVLYVYRSEDDARNGTSAGGSGFFVSMPSKVQGRDYIYAVTNKHVIDAGASVLRINTMDGKSDTIQTSPDTWETMFDDDLAVLPLQTLPVTAGVWAVPVDMFLDPHRIALADIGPGDDVALLGRFITHDGRQRNKPVARFGNIAMSHDYHEPIRVGDGRNQVGVLVECRSLSGFSGSPVFVYPDIARRPSRSLNTEAVNSRLAEPRLLGVDCGHLPTWAGLFEARDRSSTQLGGWVDTNSGIAVVVPAWHLAKVLNQDHLAQQRRGWDTASSVSDIDS